MSVDTAFCPEIVKYLKKGMYDIVVLTVLASPTALLAAYTLQHRKIPYYYEGDGGFAGQASGVKATLKRYIIRAAEKCLSSSKEFDRYCMTYGEKAVERGIRSCGGMCRYIRGTVHPPERHGSVVTLL